MSNGVHKVSLFLGSQGGLTLDQLNSARTHVASLSKEYSTESDSSASASASTSVTSSPFKGQGRPYKGNIPRLNLDGNG